jgi:hypothetical protein
MPHTKKDYASSPVIQQFNIMGNVRAYQYKEKLKQEPIIKGYERLFFTYEEWQEFIESCWMASRHGRV